MLKVHRDDPCEVYITVRMPDGREKQTTVGYLQRVLPTQVPHDAGSKKFHQWDARGDRKESTVYPTQAELDDILFELAAESQEQYEEVPLMRNNRQGFMMKFMPEIAKKYKDLQQLTIEDLTTEQFRTNISDAADKAYAKWV